MKPFRLHGKGPYLIKYRGPDGRWYRQVGGNTRADAEQFLGETLKAIQAGLWAPPSTTRTMAKERSVRTWDELTTEWTKARRDEGKLTETTIRGYCAALARVAIVLPGKTPLVGITADLVAKLRLKLRKAVSPLTGRTFDRSTVNITVGVWHSVVAWGVRHHVPDVRREVLDVLLAFRSEGSRGSTDNSRQVTADDCYSEAEQALILAECDKSESREDTIAIALALGTGCRRNELSGFEWGDIDLAERVAQVRRQGDGRLPKSGLIRAVPFTPELAQRLRVWKAASVRKGDSHPVLPRPDGSHYAHMWDLAPALRRVCKTAGITKKRYFNHQLRHSYATMWLARGGSVPTLVRNLGHVDAKQIYRCYGHLTTFDCRDELDRIMAREERPTERPISAENATERSTS